MISIVIITKSGRKQELKRCLTSIYQSSYKNFEVILLDNSGNSTLIKEIGNKFPKVKIILMPTNTGIFAFSLGFANAKGQYLLSLDDDTEILLDTLKKIVALFEKTSRRVAIIAPYAYNPLIKHYYSPPVAANEEQISFHGSSAFRQEIFRKVGYFDADFFGPVFEDDFALRVLDAGYQIHFAKDIIINHYAQEGGLRNKQIFLNARNKAWLNIKHFSLRFFPFLIFRDLVWIFLLPYRKGPLKAFYYGLKGYLVGLLNLWIPLRKRKIVSSQLQKKYLKYYLLGDLINLWQNIRRKRK